MRSPYLAVLVVLGLLMSACSSPPSVEGTTAPEAPTTAATETTTDGEGEEAPAGDLESVLAAVEGLTGEERQEALLGLAEEEGDLNLYTSLTSDVLGPLIDAFSEQFDLDASSFRAASEDVLLRITQEADANFAGADVVETNGGEMFNLSSEGLLFPYESPAREGLIPQALFEDWTATRLNIFAISWNTSLVPEGEVPTSWQDLADPKWDGRLSIEQGDVDWYKTLWEWFVEEQGMSPEEADAIFEGIAGGALAVRGHTVTGELLAAGEFDVAASNYTYLVDNIAADGAPITWQPAVEPVISRPNGVGLMKTVQNPASALLFIDWLLSDAQEYLVESGITPARADLGGLEGLEIISVDLESFAAEEDEWTDRYEQLVMTAEEG